MTVIAILAITFFAGTLFGALIVLRLGAGRDDQNGRLPGEPPTLAAAASRRLTGLWVNAPQHDACLAVMQPRWNGGRDERF
jgi:hypothetical protein